MKELNGELNSTLEELVDESSNQYESGNIAKAKDLLVEAFNKIPEPKVEYNESYNYCSYVLNFIIDEGLDAHEAEQWLNELVKIAETQQVWKGDIDFHKGKVYFELNKFEEAHKAFEVSVKEGKGFRYFEGEDPKYLDFYRNSEKYSK